MTPVLLHAEAKAEIEAESLYYEARSAGLGLLFLAEVDAALSRIAEAPERWQRSRCGTRRVNVKRFPHSLYYLVHAGTVVVVALAPHRRRPFYWGTRL
jgi:hypothetical protein